MNYKNGTLSIPFYMFILYLLLSVFIGMGHRTKRILRIERKEYQTY